MTNQFPTEIELPTPVPHTKPYRVGEMKYGVRLIDDGTFCSFSSYLHRLRAAYIGDTAGWELVELKTGEVIPW